jgi:hypothetical protein
MMGLPARGDAQREELSMKDLSKDGLIRGIKSQAVTDFENSCEEYTVTMEEVEIISRLSAGEEAERSLRQKTARLNAADNRIAELEKENSEMARQLAEPAEWQIEKDKLEKECEKLKADALRGISNLANWLADYLCKKHNEEFLLLKTYEDVAKFTQETGCAICNRQQAAAGQRAVKAMDEFSNKYKQWISDYPKVVQKSKFFDDLIEMLQHKEAL